jgi:hypothetical protein
MQKEQEPELKYTVHGANSFESHINSHTVVQDL